MALDGLLRKAGLAPDESVGVVGWKLMEKKGQKGECEFDIPYYIMMAVKSVMNGRGSLVNAAGLFLDPDCGVRITADADEIAHYEYGASLASNCVQDAMDALAVGRSEIETANAMRTDGPEKFCGDSLRIWGAVCEGKSVSVGKEAFSGRSRINHGGDEGRPKQPFGICGI